MQEANDAWVFTRSETRQILDSLSDQQLLFRPEGPKWQPLYYQFACMVRTQLVYAKALRTGEMDFAYFADETLPDKHALNTRLLLDAALDEAAGIWQSSLAAGNTVSWQGQKMSVAGHLYRLISHERLHHGQLIGYFTMAGYELPADFKQNWAL